MDSTQQPCSSAQQCSICTQEAHGIHFGVYSCRACAAFFRRCVVLKKSYKCKKTEGQCEIDKNDRHFCRACRLQKCFAVGMTEENVQLNRDRMSSVVSKRTDCLPESKKTSETEPPKTCTKKPPVTITNDLPWFPPKIERELDEIFAGKRPYLIEFNGLRGLARMTEALKAMRAEQTEDVQIVSVLDRRCSNWAWDISVLQTARWMQSCEEFAKLDKSSKMTLFDRNWSCLQRLERLAKTVEDLGERVFNERILYTYGPYAITEQTKFVAFDCCHADMGKVKSIHMPSFDIVIPFICRPIFEMDLSIEELTYALLQVMWHIEGAPIDEETMKVADDVRERVSSELYQYYLKNKRQKYVDRIINIMTIVKESEKIQNDQNRVRELAQLFGFLKRPKDVFEE